MVFIPLSEVASLANIQVRAIQLAVNRRLKSANSTWRGANLEVREAFGRGGRSGRCYEIRVESLPLDLQARRKELLGPVEAPLKLDDTTSAEC